jgi:hypothetical protein
MAFAIAISQFIGMSRNWEDAVVYTVVLFTVVTLALRSAWGYARFWQNLTRIFALHLLAVIIFEQALPPGVRGPHGLWLVIGGMAEGLLIAGVVWKKTVC